LEQWAKMG